MFRTAELGQSVSKQDFKKRARDLRQRLLEAQILLSRDAEFSVMIDFAGVDGAGKGSTVNLLNAWLDTRLLTTNAFGPPTEAQRERPGFWRYWRALPPKGRTGLNLRGRYSRPFLDRVNERISDTEYVAELNRIQAFEQALADDDVLILKFWMHLSRDAQEERLKALEADPEQSWRVTEKDWEHWKIYDRFVATAERTITETNTGYAPWHIVEGVDENYRLLEVAEIILAALSARLDSSKLGISIDDAEDSGADREDTLPERPKGLVLSLIHISEPTRR